MVKELIHDPVLLARKSEPATKDDLQTAADLLDTLAAHRETCVGMAANMIGICKRVIAFDNEGSYMVMYNPRIVKASGGYETEESCLSLLGGPRKTRRFQKIKVEYQTEAFQTRLKTFEGWTAQIIQHEIDHCDGILIWHRDRQRRPRKFPGAARFLCLHWMLRWDRESLCGVFHILGCEQMQIFLLWLEHISMCPENYSISTPTRGASMEQWILPRPFESYYLNWKSGGHSWGHRIFGRSVIIGFRKTQSYQRFLRLSTWGVYQKTYTTAKQSTRCTNCSMKLCECHQFFKERRPCSYMDGVP